MLNATQLSDIKNINPQITVFPLIELIDRLQKIESESLAGTVYAVMSTNDGSILGILREKQLPV